MDVDPSPTSWLASAKTSAPTPLAEQIVGQLETAYSKKSVVRSLGGMNRTMLTSVLSLRLWHNLTIALLRYIKLPETGPFQVEMFNLHASLRLIALEVVH